MKEFGLGITIFLIFIIALGTIHSYFDAYSFSEDKVKYCLNKYNNYEDVIRCEGYNVDQFFINELELEEVK